LIGDVVGKDIRDNFANIVEDVSILIITNKNILGTNNFVKKVEDV
jgi:hypothetical protein